MAAPSSSPGSPGRRLLYTLPNLAAPSSPPSFAPRAHDGGLQDVGSDGAEEHGCIALARQLDALGFMQRSLALHEALTLVRGPGGEKIKSPVPGWGGAGWEGRQWNGRQQA